VPPPCPAAHLFEIFKYIAMQMVTAAATYIFVHGDERRLAIAKWALSYALRGHIMDVHLDIEVDMDAAGFIRWAVCVMCILHMRLPWCLFL
jgi:hypothetical protein